MEDTDGFLPTTPDFTPGHPVGVQTQHRCLWAPHAGSFSACYYNKAQRSSDSARNRSDLPTSLTRAEMTSEMTLVYLKRANVQSPVLPLLSEVIFPGPVWSPYTARENPTDNQLAAGELTPALMSPLRSKALKHQRNNWATPLLYPSYKWCSLVCSMQMRSSFRAARFPMVLRYKSTCVYCFSNSINETA